MNSAGEHVSIPEEPGPQLDSFAAANRWYNLLASSVLCLGGLTFGFVAFQEQDLPDKADDGAFLVIALLALSWYIWPRQPVQALAAANPARGAGPGDPSPGPDRGMRRPEGIWRQHRRRVLLCRDHGPHSVPVPPAQL